MKRTRAYIRYSDHKQDDGYSVEYQTAEINAFIEKNGLDLQKLHIDQAMTATQVAGREQFFTLIQAVKDGLVDVVLVYKMNRIFRNALESHKYRKLFRDNGVKFMSVTQHIDEDTSEGRFMTSTLANVDQYQSEITSDHVKASMREMARQGYHTGGIPLFGYDLQSIQFGKKVRKKLTPNAGEAAIVNTVFELYAAGHEVGYIRAYINDTMGARTKRGGYFYVQIIHRMLKNDAYIGTVRFKSAGYDEIVVENAHTAIIPITLWHTVQSRLDNRPKIKPRKHPQKRIYALTGKVFCACGSHCIGISGKNKKHVYNYYKCASKNTFGKCGVASVRREKLHKDVMREIKLQILNEDKINSLAAEIVALTNSPAVSLTAQIKQLTKEKNEVEHALNVLIDMRVNGEISGDIVKKRSAVLDGRLPKLENQLAVLKDTKNTAYSLDDIKAYLLDMLAKTEIDNDDITRSIFNTFVEKVTISNTTIKVELKLTQPKAVSFNITSGTPTVRLNNTLYR